MKKWTFALLLVQIAFSMPQAQNLIVNPSFEEHADCAANLIDFEDLPGWRPLGTTTPDVYCPGHISPAPGYALNGVPKNNWGFQYALTGDSYIGFVAYRDGTPYTTGRNEYMVATLNNPLKKDSIYYFEMHVSAADHQSSYAIDRLGAYFTDSLKEDTLKYETNFTYLSGPPQVESPKGVLLDDSVGWARINGFFRARGGERYAVLGNFRKNSEVKTKRISIYNNDAYYYMDDVSLYPVSIDLPDTVSLCPGEEFVLDANINPVFQPVSYSWNRDVTTPAITVGKAGDYMVEIKFNDLTLRDTVKVLVLPEGVELGVDTTICGGSSFYLGAGDGFDHYLWQDGSTSSGYRVEQPGEYEVSVSNGCGAFSDKIKVETEKCECSVYIPEAFSPNDDGINDRFQTWFSCGLAVPENYSLRVFDRWGNMMFETKDLGQGWDGSRKGNPAGEGIYIWKIQYRYHNPDKGWVENEKFGELVLVR